MDYFVIEVEILVNDLKIEIDDAYSITNTTINKKSYMPNDAFLSAVENNFGNLEGDSDFLNDFIDSMVDAVVAEKKRSFLPHPSIGDYKDNWDDAVIVNSKTYVERKEE